MPPVSHFSENYCPVTIICGTHRLSRIRSQDRAPNWAKLLAVLSEVFLVPNEYRNLLTALRFQQGRNAGRNAVKEIAEGSIKETRAYMQRHPNSTLITYVDNMCK